MGMTLAHVEPSIVAAFLASLVELVEAPTVILAIGAVRGWRGALSGTAAALAILLTLIAMLGGALTRLSLNAIQLVVGVLLLLFGMRWLCKSILRAAGVIPLHDETEAFAKATGEARRYGVSARWKQLRGSRDIHGERSRKVWERRGGRVGLAFANPRHPASVLYSCVLVSCEAPVPVASSRVAGLCEAEPKAIQVQASIEKEVSLANCNFV